MFGISLNKSDFLSCLMSLQKKNILTAPGENVSSGTCRQRRPIACKSTQSDQNLHCPLTESFDTIECINWDYQMARMRLCACAGWCESAHFAHTWRHFFAWRGPTDYEISTSDRLPGVGNWYKTHFEKEEKKNYSCHIYWCIYHLLYGIYKVKGILHFNEKLWS